MGHDRDSDLPTTWAYLAEIYAADIAALPEPPKEFEWNDADMPVALKHRLRHRGVFVLTASRRDPDHAGEASRYRVHPDIYEVAARNAKHVSTLPCCNSTGITNDAGTIRCKRCGTVVDREVAREVLS